jgi:signal transduction histidine kinase
MAWDHLRETMLPACAPALGGAFEETLDHLPRALSRAGRHYQIDYRPIVAGDRIEKVLLVISDVTEATLRERREIEQKERLALFQRIMQDREGFAEFVTEGERLESPEERVAAGKPAAGRIALSLRETGDEVIFEVADDGGGIDWETLREKAVQRGLPGAAEADRVDLLLHGGVSTKATVAEVSGRGVGVMAAYQACVDLGGRIEIDSKRGVGTTFRFRIPSDDAVGATPTSAA